MELQYIWVENYKCLNNQGFNFSHEYSFYYNHKLKKLYAKKNDIYIKNFFKIENRNKSSLDLTALIGSNGAGKSTVLSLIKEIFLSDSMKNLSYILVIKSKGEYFIYSQDEIYIDDSIPHKNIKKIHSYFKKFMLIYHSNIFEYNNYLLDNSEIYCDISTGGLTKKEFLKTQRKEVDYNIKDSNNLYFFNELNRQIEFIKYLKQDIHLNYNNQNGFKTINFIEELVIPKTLKIMLHDNNKRYQTILEKIKDMKGFYSSSIDKFVDCIYSIKKAYVITRKNRIKSNLKQSFIFNHIYNLILFMIEEFVNTEFNINKDWDILCKLVNNVLKSQEDYYRSQHNLKDILIHWKNFKEWTIEEKEFTYYKEYYEIIINLDKIMNEEFLSNFKYTNKLDIRNIEVLTTFYEATKYYAFKVGFPIFSWSLSSGENNMLSFFSRLYSCKKQIGKSYGKLNYLFLIDEVDMSYHPEWQRRYIYNVVLFIDYLFGKNNSIQLIITTHSPILLSDIPHSNVIYLLNSGDCINKEKKTFASNIYDLYNDSFFLEQDILTSIIGKFSSNKIKELVKKLDQVIEIYSLEGRSSNYNKLNLQIDLSLLLKEIEQMLNLVGDDIIYNHIYNKYIEIIKILKIEDEEDKYISLIYENLSDSQKEKLINYIIKTQEEIYD